MQNLPRVLGPFSIIAIVIGTMIGSGIFIVPSSMAADLKSPLLMLAVWVVGGVLSFFGALALSELGAAYPQAGGMYIFLREAYGPLVSFLFGWTLFLIIDAGSMATLAVAFSSKYLPQFVNLSAAGTKAVAVALIAALAVINYLGVKWGAFVQNLFTVIKTAALIILIGAVFAFAKGNAAHFTTNAPGRGPGEHRRELRRRARRRPLGAQGVGSLDLHRRRGQEPGEDPAAGHFRRDVHRHPALSRREPGLSLRLPSRSDREIEPDRERRHELRGRPGGRDLHRRRHPVFDHGRVQRPPDDGPARLFRDGPRRRLFQERRPAASALPHAPFLHPGGQPVGLDPVRLRARSSSSSRMSSSGLWIFFGLTVAAVFILRKKRPDLARPYRTWGYPVTPALFVAAALYISVNTLVNKFWNSFVGLALILSVSRRIYTGEKGQGIRGRDPNSLELGSCTLNSVKFRYFFNHFSKNLLVISATAGSLNPPCPALLTV